MNIGEEPYVAKATVVGAKDVRTKKVKGWLAWLCFGLVFGGPYGALIGILSDYKYFHRLFSAYPRLQVVHWTNAAVKVGIAIFAIVAGAKLYRLKKDGPRTAKIFLVAVFGSWVAYYLLLLSAGLPPGVNRILLRGMMTVLPLEAAIVGAWYAYLVRSKRVKWTYGEVGGTLDVLFEQSPVEEGSSKKKVTCPQCRQSEDVPSNKIYDPASYEKFSATAKRRFGFLSMKLTCRSCGKQFTYEDNP
jgi:hypothetical protein